MEERKVVEAAQRGDRRAFEVLVRYYQPKILRTIYHLLGDENESDDVAQEVWVRVYRSLPTFRRECRFSTWLYRITANEALTALKRLQQQRKRVVDHPLEELPHADGKPNARRILEGQEMGNQFQEAFAELPEKQKMVVTLVVFEELPHAEVGKILGMAEKTVSWHLFKAREFLAEKMNVSSRFS